MRTAVIACLLSALSAAALAQTAAPAGPTVGFMHAIHATNNLETTAAFYRDVFGLSAPIRPFANEAVPILTDSPGVTLRITMLPIPNGFNFELTEFTNVARTPAQARISDPGAPHMKFLVRDIAPVVAAVKKLGAPIVTRSGNAVTLKTDLAFTMKAIVVRDPDGYLIEAIELPAAADAPAGNVHGAIMGLTVADLDTAVKFWGETLGFPLTGDRTFSSDPAMLDLMGIAPGGSFRTLTAMVPGSRARIEFTEFKGMPRSEFSLRVPDPGASGMAIRVTGLDALVAKMKASGVRVISRNREIVQWSPTLRNVFVKDPGGLNIELVEQAPAAR